MERADAAIGCLLGTAVGDALGLPCEGLSRRRAQRMFPSLEGYQFAFGRGMCSDDTDHACMLAQSVAVSGGNTRRFLASFSWRLRFWLLGLPAGIGSATLRSILKLWFFVPPQFSGVRSAGNGPAMRSALLGVLFHTEEPLLVMHCSAATTVTHRDPKAESGALAIALAARSSMHGEPPRVYLAHLGRLLAPFEEAGRELGALAERALDSALRGESTAQFVATFGCANGVTGYMYHSVPAALHAWFAHPRDLHKALAAAIRCGGDTDTVAAMTGGIVGASLGRKGISPHLLEDLWDWPRGAAWMEEVARRAADAVERRSPTGALFLSPVWLLVRNVFFLALVLGHGFRRLAPPY